MPLKHLETYSGEISIKIFLGWQEGAREKFKGGGEKWKSVCVKHEKIGYFCNFCWNHHFCSNFNKFVIILGGKWGVTKITFLGGGGRNAPMPSCATATGNLIFLEKRIRTVWWYLMTCHTLAENTSAEIHLHLLVNLKHHLSTSGLDVTPVQTCDIK